MKRLPMQRLLLLLFSFGLTLLAFLVCTVVLSIRLGHARAESEALQAEVLQLQSGAPEAIPPVVPPEPAPTDTEPDDPTPSPTDVPAAEAIGYQTLYPEMMFTDMPEAVGRANMTVYLTFDDGPSARTDEILAILDAYDVKATFFVTGPDTESRRARIRAAYDAGHTIGIHTYTHVYTDIYASVEAFLEDFHQVYEMVLDCTGEAPRVCRFPGGSINGYNSAICGELMSEVLRRGFVYYDWNLSGEDALRGATAENITSRILSQAVGKTRGILLLHDSDTQTETVAALPAVIEGLQGMGFSFSRLSNAVLPFLFSYDR